MMQEYGLGRLAAKDARDARFVMRTVTPAVELPVHRRYRLGPVLDQGATPRCVAFAGEAWFNALPMRTIKRAPNVNTLYAGAQTHDEWRDQPHDGSSVRGLFKYLDHAGYVERYLWSWTVDGVLGWVLGGSGTVVIGVNFYDSMFELDTHGLMNIAPNARLVGGHAMLLYGADRAKGVVFIRNSWGLLWGRDGNCLMSFETLERLLREDGEACGAEERRVQP